MAAAKARVTKAHPTSNTTLAKRVDELTARVEALEDVLNAARIHQQQQVAAQLAQNPARMQELQALLEMAQATAAPAAATVPASQ